MVSSHTDKESLSTRLRAKRMHYLDEILSSFERGGVQMADLGGTASFWEMNLKTLRYANRVSRIDLFNLHPEASGERVINGIPLCFKKGDVRSLDVPDKKYDIAFSNSVIEHVGNLSDQACFSREIQRIARYFLLQTPNRSFPLEPHFYVPFFAAMPLSFRAALHQRFRLGWLERELDPLQARIDCDQIRLLNRYELRLLFPDSIIHKETLFGLVKSFVACNQERR